MNDGPASRVIDKWIHELEASSGSVSHADAVKREGMVVSMVNNGQWDINAYHDYQRFAAGSGIPCLFIHAYHHLDCQVS